MLQGLAHVIHGRKRQFGNSASAKAYPSCEQQTSGIGSCVICQPDLDAVSWEFVSISRADNHISFQFGIRYLTNDIFVCETHNQSILWRVVLVFVLNNEATSGKIVSFSLWNGNHENENRGNSKAWLVKCMYVALVWAE